MHRLTQSGLFFMAVGAFFFSLMALMVKLAGSRIPSQEIVLVRSCLNLLFTYVLIRRAGAPVWGVNRRLLLVRGIAGFVGLSCVFFAIPRLPLADGIVLVNTYPVFTAVLALPLLGELVGLVEVLALGLSLSGVTVMSRPALIFGSTSAALDPLAVSIALAGALSAAFAYVVVRKLRITEHPLTVVFYFPLVTVPISVPFVLVAGVWPTPFEWLLLIGVGITSQIGQVAITEGLHRERAGRATAVTYLQFVFGLIWGWMFFSEFPDVWRLVGAGLILGGVLLIATKRRR